jgi:LemA protein
MAAVLLVIIVGLFVLALIAALVGVAIYNGLVKGRQGARNGWAQIDVQLKRRHDLIPNLVNTVKGFATHEKETLENVINARARATSAGTTSEAIKAEGELTHALGRLLAVTEAYPDLKANANFMQLQGELTSTEDIISRSRGGYNGVVGGYNQSLVVFPTNIIAGMFGFKQMPFFEIENAAERNAPQVKF